MDDRELLALLHSDPDRGMRELMHRYTGLVCAVIRARFAGFSTVSTDIEDCAADTFSNFWLGLGGYDPEKAEIRTYLAAIARNIASDYLKKQRIRQLSAETPWEEAEEILVDIPDGSDAEAAEQELRRTVLHAVRSLGEPDSSILFLKYYLGKKSAEIAAKLGMTAANVDNRASRAVKKIRTALRGAEN